MSDEPRVHPRAVRTALRRSDLSGTFLVGKYALAPYMACGHGCAYCDGRAERYWVEGDFQRDIVARRNLPDLLAHELRKLREPGFITLGSGITDAYQPVEADEQLTRRCAEVLSGHAFPVTVITKSALPMRDLDLWRTVNERSRFLLVVSLVHPGDRTRAEFEPGASSVPERIELLRSFRAAGCATGVLAMPLLPGLTDGPNEIRELYDRLAEAGVDFIQPGGLTLRPGRQKDFFMRRLRETHEELVPVYDDRYRENRRSGAPLATYKTAVDELTLAENARTAIPRLVPHHVYAGLLAPYDEAAVLLRHMVELYSSSGVDTARLRAATARYLDRLTARKREYNRHPSWDYRELSEEILVPGALESMIGNDRLATLLRRVLLERAVFDYSTLTLRG